MQWMGRCVRLGGAGLAGLLVLAVAGRARADRSLHAVGVPQIGPNSDCGTQVWQLTGISAGPESHGDFRVGASPKGS